MLERMPFGQPYEDSGETGKGMNLGEVRVDRTSVHYLVHAVEGGGPVHRHGGLTPVARGPTRSKGKDHLRLGTCPGEAGWTCPVPEDYQVHREEVLETDSQCFPSWNCCRMGTSSRR